MKEYSAEIVAKAEAIFKATPPTNMPYKPMALWFPQTVAHFTGLAALELEKERLTKV